MAVAGGKMDGQRAVELARKISPARLFVMYGQTEATARLSYLPPVEFEENADTIGRSIPGVEFSIRDDNGREVDDGVTGTLFARGDNIMLGYWNDPCGTQRVLNHGWLNTGDLAMVQTNGLIRLCGRKNRLIKTQGYRFHPAEVEQILSKQLADVQLVAIPMNFHGKTRLALFAKPRTQQPVTKREIQDACRRLLPRHMIPQRCTIVDSWPVNSANKIDRRALQNQVENRSQMTSAAGTQLPVEESIETMEGAL